METYGFDLSAMGARMADVKDRVLRDSFDRWNAKPLQERAKLTRLNEENQARLAALNPQEKWERMKNPSCADDYGLVMSSYDLCAVPEAMHEVSIWLPPMSNV